MLTNKRTVRKVSAAGMAFEATASTEYFEGGLVGLDTATGKLDRASTASTFVPLGYCARSITLGASGGSVLVRFFAQVEAGWFKNEGSDPVTTADLGKIAQVVDDETVSVNSGYSSAADLGIVLKVDASKGVLVKVN